MPTAVAADGVVVAQGIIDLPDCVASFDLAACERGFARELWPPVAEGWARWERELRWSEDGRRLAYRIIDRPIRKGEHPE